MADQIVKFEGDSGSRERVSLDMAMYILQCEKNFRPNRHEVLNLFVDCMEATYQNRPQE